MRTAVRFNRYRPVIKIMVFYLSKTATSGTFKNIGDTLRNHPENALDKLDNASDLVINHKKILADVRKDFCSILALFVVHIITIQNNGFIPFPKLKTVSVIPPGSYRE